MGKSKKRTQWKAAAGKVQLKSAKNALSVENVNQKHNTQKEALGPNTER